MVKRKIYVLKNAEKRALNRKKSALIQPRTSLGKCLKRATPARGRRGSRRARAKQPVGPTQDLALEALRVSLQIEAALFHIDDVVEADDRHALT